MTNKLVQEQRIAKLTTPLGQDVLAVTRFHVSEGLSELFDIAVDALSENEDIDFDTLIGQSCTITQQTFDGVKRAFNGVLVSAEWNGRHDETHAYRLTLRPWLWLLGHVSDCRIYHDKNANDIIRDVFSRRGFSDFRFATTCDYPSIEYVVQYRETDLNFVCRIMERFGIYFFFEHSDGQHVLVMADAKSSHAPTPDLASVKYQPQQGQSRHDSQRIEVWTSARQFRTGKVTLNDYNFKTPTANMIAEKAKPGQYLHGSLEYYDYPGHYPAAGEGVDRATAQIEAEQAQDHRRFGTGVAVSLTPGGLVQLEGHPRAPENKQYLVLRCMHNFEGEAFRSGGGGGGTYSGAYEFMPADSMFRAPNVTPRPIVHGPQTAFVTGEQGEEIDVDTYGRILVRFHWDRDKGQSCRVRVAQVWSGKNWGGQVIPRIGQEVVVEFLEGDPDQPLVTGAVYNADNVLPYALPDNKTMAGVKSNSTKGGGGYNEFVFEDKKGSEFIRMHGERDHEVVIRNTESITIGETFATAAGSPSRTHLLVNGDDVLTVQAGNQQISIGAKQELTVTTDRKKSVGGKEEIAVQMDRKATIGMNDQVDVGQSQKISAGMDVEVAAGQSHKTTAGLNVEVTAGLSIKLRASGGSIEIGPAGVTITGVLVQIN